MKLSQLHLNESVSGEHAVELLDELSQSLELPSFKKMIQSSWYRSDAAVESKPDLAAATEEAVTMARRRDVDPRAVTELSHKYISGLMAIFSKTNGLYGQASKVAQNLEDLGYTPPGWIGKLMHDVANVSTQQEKVVHHLMAVQSVLDYIANVEQIAYNTTSDRHSDKQRSFAQAVLKQLGLYEAA